MTYPLGPYRTPAPRAQPVPHWSVRFDEARSWLFGVVTAGLPLAWIIASVREQRVVDFDQSFYAHHAADSHEPGVWAQHLKDRVDIGLDALAASCGLMRGVSLLLALLVWFGLVVAGAIEPKLRGVPFAWSAYLLGVLALLLLAAFCLFPGIAHAG